MFWALLLHAALAADCPAPAPAVAGDLAVALADVDLAKPAAPRAPSGDLPAGTLSADDLEAFFQFVSDKGGGIRDLFGALADGQQRVLPGDVVRGLFDKYGVDLPFLPLDDLVQITSNGREVTFEFDFGGSSRKDVRLPDATVWKLKPRGSDPYAVNGSSRVKQETVKGRTLSVADRVTFRITPEGIEGMSKGAIKASGFNLDIHTERHPGKVATDGKWVLLQSGEDGKPLVVDGRYQPQVYDDWAVITAFLTRIEIGIPSLGRR